MFVGNALKRFYKKNYKYFEISLLQTIFVIKNLLKRVNINFNNNKIYKVELFSIVFRKIIVGNFIKQFK